ncbi:MAG: DegV family protein [Lactobacillaceae bacterium]|jgi:DegV family protein with EDD domain|nr:DegV family protein [Lactobacillaceae bacterium]
MKIAIVTDSTATLTQAEIEKYHIYVEPIPFIFDDQVYREGVDLTTAEFYEMLQTSTSFPSTSQPSLGDTLALYQQIKADGYDTIIAIHLASTISGYVNNIASLDGAVDGLKVIAYDSMITVRLMGQLVLKAAGMVQAGVELDTILATLDTLRATMDEYFVVDDLQNLVRGGRLSNAGAIIGTMLKVKPILTFDNDTNHIVPFEKVRSMKKALKAVEDLFDQAIATVDYPLRATVFHANDEVAGRAWQQELQQRHPEIPVEFSYIGAVIGTHLGQGALALTWIREPESL